MNTVLSADRSNYIKTYLADNLYQLQGFSIGRPFGRFGPSRPATHRPTVGGVNIIAVLRNDRSLDQWAEGKQLMWCFFLICVYLNKSRLRFVRFISSMKGSHKTKASKHMLKITFFG